MTDKDMGASSGPGSTRSAPEAPAGLRPPGDDPSREDVMLAVQDADERMASFVAALVSAGSYDARRELWLQAVEDSQLEADLHTLFGAIPRASDRSGEAGETRSGSTVGESAVTSRSDGRRPSSAAPLGEGPEELRETLEEAARSIREHVPDERCAFAAVAQDASDPERQVVAGALHADLLDRAAAALASKSPPPPDDGDGERVKWLRERVQLLYEELCGRAVQEQEDSLWCELCNRDVECDGTGHDEACLLNPYSHDARMEAAALSAQSPPPIMGEGLDAKKLRANIETAYRRAGGLPRLARTPEGRKVIVDAAVNEAMALATAPASPGEDK